MVFSTILEPFPALLNRIICALQPYQDPLKRGAPVKDNCRDEIRFSSSAADALAKGDRSQQSTGGVGMLACNNDTLTRAWMRYYQKLPVETNSTDHIGPKKDVPDVTGLMPFAERNYQRLGAALLGANRDLFASFGRVRTPPRLAATLVTQDTRVSMDNAAFIISSTILGIYLVVGIVLYAR